MHPMRISYMVKGSSVYNTTLLLTSLDDILDLASE